MFLSSDLLDPQKHKAACRGSRTTREIQISARFGQYLEPRRDIDAIAKQILALHDHVTDIHADAKAHLLLLRKCLLHRNGASR